MILGYGNWSRNSQMKGCSPTMGRGLRRAIEKKIPAYSVDEYNTSKICSKCGSKLENKKIGNKKIHRVLICKTCHHSKSVNGRDYFINRDVNGALNIFKCSKEWIFKQERPSCLKRKKSSSDDDSQTGALSSKLEESSNNVLEDM